LAREISGKAPEGAWTGKLTTDDERILILEPA